jgi:hypothetical protein
MEPSCTVVLGCPRSGTSLAAGLLHRLGVCMGEHLVGPHPMNPRGFYEDRHIQALHGSFIEMKDYPVFSLREGSRRDYEAYLRKREAEGRPWGFKDRWSPWVFPLTRQLVKQPLRVVRTHRPVHESVSSWAATHTHRPAEEARTIIGDALHACHLALANFDGPVLHLDYHDVLAEPEVEVQRLADFVGYQGDQSEALAFVDPILRRF